MLNIADFGGFSGIAKMIQQVKDTGERLVKLSTNSGVPEILEFKVKFIDALDKFRPGNTTGVSSVAPDFEGDADKLEQTIKAKITDQNKLEPTLQEFRECREVITRLLGVVVNALKKAG